jgi:hypothetical protein
MSKSDDRVRLHDVNVTGGPVDRAALLDAIKQAVADSGLVDPRGVEAAVAKAVRQSRAAGRES